MSTTTTSPLVESLDAQARALTSTTPAGSRAAARARALEAAQRHGLPSTRQERWKYTALRALAARRFEAPGEPPGLDAEAIADIPAPRLVFANGRLVAERSDLSGLPAGVRVAARSQGAAEAGDATERDLGRADDALLYWTLALAEEGLVVEVPAGVAVEHALHLVLVGVADGSDRALHLRHRVVLGDGARLALAVHQRGIGAHRHLNNALVEIHLGDGAELVEARLQCEAEGATLLQRTEARLGARARYRRLDLELGAGLSRHELEAVLAGEGAALDAHGVLLADGRRHLDTRLGIEHRARDTRCELIWRGLGAQRGRAVFHGGILIAEGADGSDAQLSNKNLLLDDGAEIDTQPVLVIHADDVKAAHGATVGRLDPQALFYLRARGLPKPEASALLTAAFLRETLDVLDHPGLAAMAEAALAARLSAAGGA
jgi:Fe-S cluster assembly protein SufD